MVSRVPKQTLRARVAEHLLDAIIKSELRPGDRIVEGTIARELGVAKTTLREALSDLEHRGLVMKTDKGATFVTKLAVSDVENIYGVRLLLEPQAAVLAHQRLTPKGYSHLVALLNRMKTAGDHADYLEASKHDMAFHQFIWELSGNVVLERALNAVAVPGFAFSGLRLMRVFSKDAKAFARIWESHQVLLAKLKEGPAKEIRRVFAEKLQVFKAQNFEAAQLLDGALREGKSRVGEAQA
ncbi:MAG: GntR family transcriptional regulator [Terriglobia bacterium]